MNALQRIASACVTIVFVSPGILHAAAPHTGQIVRRGFQPSDLALFVAAVVGVWLARRSMRARRRKD